MKARVVILVPVYKARLAPLEEFSLDVSLNALAGRNVAFIAPNGILRNYYERRYPNIPFIFFEMRYFEDIQGYNKLMLGQDFYERFLDYEFMLILQTDAVVLRDELDFWMDAPFDYVGAPWPAGNELFVNLGRFDGAFGKSVKVHVGNGGLSLRRTRKCLALLLEFVDATKIFLRTGSSEDLFFSFMGVLSEDFILPNEIIASRFSLEVEPRYYIHVNGGRTPMGGHAWWRYDLEFWRELLPSIVSR